MLSQIICISILMISDCQIFHASSIKRQPLSVACFRRRLHTFLACSRGCMPKNSPGQESSSFLGSLDIDANIHLCRNGKRKVLIRMRCPVRWSTLYLNVSKMIMTNFKKLPNLFVIGEFLYSHIAHM